MGKILITGQTYLDRQELALRVRKNTDSEIIICAEDSDEGLALDNIDNTVSVIKGRKAFHDHLYKEIIWFDNRKSGKCKTKKEWE
tara:strand:- start:1492 stop:1746 length:255 start_codon:yes stop_codon:yes gene_type:complete